ncbi:hypothetical protein GCM10027277_11960 [Pseudoduganella ginsengisoli]
MAAPARALVTKALPASGTVAAWRDSRAAAGMPQLAANATAKNWISRVRRFMMAEAYQLAR